MSTQDDIVRICAIESHYWGEVLDDNLSEIAIGAMGAAANICAAIMRGLSPEQFELEVNTRNQSIADWATKRGETGCD